MGLRVPPYCFITKEGYRKTKEGEKHGIIHLVFTHIGEFNFVTDSCYSCKLLKCQWSKNKQTNNLMKVQNVFRNVKLNSGVNLCFRLVATRVFNECLLLAFVFSKKLLWLAQTNVITFKVCCHYHFQACLLNDERCKLPMLMF